MLGAEIVCLFFSLSLSLAFSRKKRPRSFEYLFLFDSRINERQQCKHLEVQLHQRMSRHRSHKVYVIFSRLRKYLRSPSLDRNDLYFQYYCRHWSISTPKSFSTRRLSTKHFAIIGTWNFQVRSVYSNGLSMIFMF